MKQRLLQLFLILFLPLLTLAQTKNTMSEVKDYREVDGKIIIEMVVNGVCADFVLDLAGENAILPEYVEKFKIDTVNASGGCEDDFEYKRVLTSKKISFTTISFGNNVFANGENAYVLKDEPYLRKLGVAGTIGASLFQNLVLTIDSKRHKITITAPYRPSYMKLDHRADLEILSSVSVVFSVTIGETSFRLLFDTWNSGGITLTANDYEKVKGVRGGEVTLYRGYAEGIPTCETRVVAKCDFVKSNFTNVTVAKDNELPCSVLGTEILKEGILSIDFQKRKAYFQPFDLAVVKDEVIETEVIVESGKLNPITREYFLEHVYDYRIDKEFIFKGDKPVVIDFWATWCGPCMRLIPELEKMATEYKDQVIFLKVNADKEKELCSMFNVVALPTLFFIPVGGKPIIEIGATPEKYEEIIQKQLLK